MEVQDWSIMDWTSLVLDQFLLLTELPHGGNTVVKHVFSSLLENVFRCFSWFLSDLIFNLLWIGISIRRDNVSLRLAKLFVCVCVFV